MGFLEANPDRQVICDHRNVDWFTEFLIFDWLPYASGKSLQRKKRLVYEEMNKKWSLSWSHNWHTYEEMVKYPQETAERIRRRHRLRDDDYDIPFFNDASFSPDNLEVHKREVLDRMDQMPCQLEGGLHSMCKRAQSGYSARVHNRLRAQKGLATRRSRTSIQSSSKADSLDVILGSYNSPFSQLSANFAPVEASALRHGTIDSGCTA